jgi:hypothetical protein
MPGARATYPGEPAAPASTGRNASRQFKRQTLDLLVQSAAVDLFHAYGIAVAPMPPTLLSACRLAEECISSRVLFSGPGLRGSMLLSVPKAVLRRTTAVAMSPEREHDWIQELCNQLMGRIKNRLVRYHVSIRAGVPTVLDPASLRHSEEDPESAYLFRTLTGPILVLLQGDFGQVPMEFSSSVEVADEGDAILF